MTPNRNNDIELQFVELSMYPVRKFLKFKRNIQIYSILLDYTFSLKLGLAAIRVVYWSD